MEPAERERLSEDEYLARERTSAQKHEYVNGELVAMAGASLRHNLIAANISRALGNRLADKPCLVVNSDQRVAVVRTRLYAYPDVTVVCGPPRFHPKDSDTIINPSLIVEVLSDTTEAYDRGAKFAHYQRLETLQHYLMVAPSERRLEHYARHASGWLLTVHENEGPVSLAALGIELTLDEVYAKADLVA